MLITGLALSACKTTTDETPQTTKFEGTWKHTTTQVDFKYVFTNNSFKATNNGKTTRAGTFTFTDTTISFDCGQYGKWTQNYTLSENDTKWQLENDGSHDRGTFIKQ
jgi:hypothetical protein